MLIQAHPDSKVHGADMGPIWGRQDPDGPHVGPMTFAIWAVAVKVSFEGRAGISYKASINIVSS